MTRDEWVAEVRRHGVMARRWRLATGVLIVMAVVVMIFAPVDLDVWLITAVWYALLQGDAHGSWVRGFRAGLEAVQAKLE